MSGKSSGLSFLRAASDAAGIRSSRRLYADLGKKLVRYMYYWHKHVLEGLKLGLPNKNLL